MDNEPQYHPQDVTTNEELNQPNGSAEPQDPIYEEEPNGAGNDNHQQPNVVFLRIVLVLSMIGSGLYSIMYLLMGFMLPIMKSQYEVGVVDIPEMMRAMYENMLGASQVYYFLTGVLYALSLAGVIMMWKLHRAGFHYYAIAQLLVIIVTILFLGRTYMNIGDIMLTLLFITYYYFSLRSIGVFKSSNNRRGES